MTSRRQFLTLCATSLSVLPLVSVGMTSIGFASDSGRRSSAVVTRQILNGLNNYRQSKGLSPLAIDARAEKAALSHSQNMAAMGRLSHDAFDTRMGDASINADAAENIAAGQNTVNAVLADWKNSSGHRANMLGDYKGVGVAVARDAISGNRPYWTMVLVA